MRLATTADSDLLAHDVDALPLALELVAPRVGRVEPLDIYVLHVGHAVGHAPGDPLVMADNNTWRAGYAHACYMVVAAVEMHLVPERWRAERQVRVVRQQRH